MKDENVKSETFFRKVVKNTAIFVIASLGLLYVVGGFTGIEPGEVGLKIKVLGDNKGISNDTLDTGIWWVEPFTYDVVVYDTRLQQYVIDDLPAQTKDGQPILVDISLELGLVDKNVPNLHETIGPDYFDQVVYPATRAATRNFTGRVLSDKIYTGDGRMLVQEAVEQTLTDKLDEYGIRVAVNLRDISFENADFVQTLERKAMAAQRVIIAERQAEQAKFDAERMANLAEGEKQKRIKAAEADREERRLKGEGERLQMEEQAKGKLALYRAEAEGLRLKNQAFGAENLVSMEWAKQMGPNIKVYGIPTGAPGTAAIIDVDGILKGAIKGVGK